MYLLSGHKLYTDSVFQEFFLVFYLGIMACGNNHLDLEILRELECPVCQEYMEPPITLCERGHNICSVCKPNVQTCGICRGDYLNTRNITLENIARSCIFPCKHHEEGCVEILPLERRKSHYLDCVYETRACPFNKLSKSECPWQGLLSGIKDHVMNVHDFETDSRKEDGEFALHLKDFGRSKSYFASVLKLGEHFSVLFKTTENEFFCIVILTGNKTKASEYKYRFTIEKADLTEYMSSDLKVQSICNNLEDILKPGTCAAFLYGSVAKFLDTDKILNCEMEIYKDDDLASSEELRKKLPHIVPRSFV